MSNMASKMKKLAKSESEMMTALAKSFGATRTMESYAERKLLHARIL